ncbi:manganese-dependent inorganic pyrophosphatase [Desulfoluna spongiiphila]|uniref:inorganic diphosphatase n=1 Tax=Desulfoluna spongiiphila TaxID=419481 RepID=A0A1G5GHM7_9BACT|nr:manganese-dependent inorganic pyrophosphatase [Desulfoluna spongiiphila]SCY50218.1 manganese-dependent inorganic pyrophosphatase [Desulfoluna spongiiphila]VVS93590.1 dhh phosphoesterase superfamily [Desulfoluna spongiiphila]
MSIYVIGHKIPDSDSVCSPIALAYLKSKLGEDTVAAVQGDLNPETAFILEKFGVAAPEVKTSFAGESVYLVDHSDLAQSPDDLGDAKVLGIVDHHKLGDVTTSEPLECWIRPVGCTGTIVKEMFDASGVEVPKDIAGLLLCAILSDTVIFKSPTCTPADKKAVEALAAIAGVDDVVALGVEMFNVKSAVAGTPIRDLVKRDYKDFNMGGKKVGVGQLEVVDLAIFDDIKADLLKDINELKAEGDRHSVLLLLTDIMKEGSELLIASDDTAIIEKAFNGQSADCKMWLDGVLSRKKQVVPNLEKVFA